MNIKLASPTYLLITLFGSANEFHGITNKVARGERDVTTTEDDRSPGKGWREVQEVSLCKTLYRHLRLGRDSQRRDTDIAFEGRRFPSPCHWDLPYLHQPEV
jgi:hypothetical protein